MASLTKMATCLTVMRLCEHFELDYETEEVTVSSKASYIGGTSAKLKAGDILTIEQLLYGLMLPSGNDASFVLAQHFGRMVYDKWGYTEKHNRLIKSYEYNYHPYYVKYFLH
jgi:D-alanyl-D-alanine carboxypeptidase